MRKGVWADLGVSLSAEDLIENQREMWKNLQREAAQFDLVNR
jgi:hypothetical protein